MDYLNQQFSTLTDVNIFTEITSPQETHWISESQWGGDNEIVDLFDIFPTALGTQAK